MHVQLVYNIEFFEQTKTLFCAEFYLSHEDAEDFKFNVQTRLLSHSKCTIIIVLLYK